MLTLFKHWDTYVQNTKPVTFLRQKDMHIDGGNMDSYLVSLPWLPQELWSSVPHKPADYLHKAAQEPYATSMWGAGIFHRDSLCFLWALGLHIEWFYWRRTLWDKAQYQRLTSASPASVRHECWIFLLTASVSASVTRDGGEEGGVGAEHKESNNWVVWVAD